MLLKDSLIKHLLSVIVFNFKYEPETVPFKGNCSYINKEIDLETEQWIADQLENGNEAAWFCVVCTGSYREVVEHDYLGCCSYKSFKDFEKDLYYTDMKKEVAWLIAHTLASHSEIYANLLKTIENPQD